MIEIFLQQIISRGWHFILKEKSTTIRRDTPKFKLGENLSLVQWNENPRNWKVICTVCLSDSSSRGSFEVNFSLVGWKREIMSTKSTAAKDAVSEVVAQTIHAKVTSALAPKVRTWEMSNHGSRELPAFLNKITAQGSTVFSVYPSLNVGGIYEVLYYTDREA